jgi:hypothetical protein
MPPLPGRLFHKAAAFDQFDKVFKRQHDRRLWEDWAAPRRCAAFRLDASLRGPLMFRARNELWKNPASRESSPVVHRQEHGL